MLVDQALREQITCKRYRIGHAALVLPPALGRLYVACDADAAGHRALEHLRARAQAEAFDIVPLLPAHDDFNDDLRALGPSALAAAVRQQMLAADRAHLDLHRAS